MSPGYVTINAIDNNFLPDFCWRNIILAILMENIQSHIALNQKWEECNWIPDNFQGSLTKCWGITLWWTDIPSRGGVVKLLVASCWGSQNNFPLVGPLCLQTDFIYPFFFIKSGIKGFFLHIPTIDRCLQ